jgi:hypothetical protein
VVDVLVMVCTVGPLGPLILLNIKMRSSPTCSRKNSKEINMVLISRFIF